MVRAKVISNGSGTPSAARPRGAAPGSENPPGLGKAGTERQGLTETLAQAEQFNQALLSTISELIFELRKDGLILSFGGPKENEFEITPEMVVGRRIMELLPVQIGQLSMHYLEKTLRTGQPQQFSCQYLYLGKLRYFETRLAACGDGHVLALVHDVTDRETLEKEVVEGSNRVQMRIGQDIHDGLGQHLTGISFLCRALERNLAAKNLPESADAAEISGLVLGALSQTRNLARGLFPVEVESSNLLHSLKELASTAEQLFHISCTVECDDVLTVDDRDASTHLFRLAQEAINNAVKHGKAQRVVIHLGAEGDRKVLRITDDGVGLPADGARRTGLGLRIMNYRARKVGGSLDLRPGEPNGTIVNCSFTLNPDEN